jgi:hypothetical protein
MNKLEAKDPRACTQNLHFRKIPWTKYSKLKKNFPFLDVSCLSLRMLCGTQKLTSYMVFPAIWPLG